MGSLPRTVVTELTPQWYPSGLGPSGMGQRNFRAHTDNAPNFLSTKRGAYLPELLGVNNTVCKRLNVVPRT